VAPVTAVWVTVAVLVVGTASTKAVGPAAMGGRSLSGPTAGVIALLAPALLAALVAYETLGAHGEGIELDERVAGLCAAAVAIVLRLPMLAVVAIAAVVTAALRAVT
jgi:branched chain amino acid efflux pump